MQRFLLRYTAIFIGIRLLAGILLVLMYFQSHEVGVLVLLDLPTIALYAGLEQLFGPIGIADVFDVRYWTLGLVVWALLGVSVGYVVWRWRKQAMNAR